MKLLSIAALLLLSSLAACGGDDTTDGMSDDASDLTPDADPSHVQRAFVVAGDFMAGAPGVSAEITTADLMKTAKAAPTGAISSDPIVRHFGDKLYVVNRFGANNVTVLNDDDYTLAYPQFATGASSNPQDVAVVGAKLYVATLGGKGLLVLQDGQPNQEIDLSALDPDHEPNCMSVYAVGTDVYVACGILDSSFAAQTPGKIAVVDTVTATMRTMVALSTKNPISLFEQLPGGDLVIGTNPDFADVTAGCIERVVPGATPTAPGCLVQNAAIGGYAAALAVQSLPAPLLWIASSSYPNGTLRGYDITTRDVWAEPVSGAGQTITDVAFCPDGDVITADQTMATNGIRVFTNAQERTTTTIAIGLKPASIHGIACY